jgi:DNA mismatch endonuclease, patch repair protein
LRVCGCQRKRKDPAHNAKYWTAKRLGNARRDRRNLRKLKSAGWKVLTIWECQTTDSANLHKKILAFLNHSKPRKSK